MFKNIVNYVIYLVLLSQIYQDYWMREAWEPNSLMKQFVEVMRVFYTVPLKAVDAQCYIHRNDTNLNGTLVQLKTTDVKNRTVIPADVNLVSTTIAAFNL